MSRLNLEDARIVTPYHEGQPRNPGGGPPTKVNANVVALGADNTDAAPILAGGFTRVTGADATKGAILPDIPIGTSCIIKNGTNAVLKIYPCAGSAINALTATTGAYSMAALVPLVFFRESATIWCTLNLVGS